MQKTLKGVFADPKVVPRRNFLKENKIKIKQMQQPCEELHKNFGNSPSRNSSALLQTYKQRPNFITTVNPKHKDTLVVAKSDQQTTIGKSTRKLFNRQNSKNTKEYSNNETRPSSSMSNLTVRDQSIQTEHDIKEEVFLKDTIIRYPSHSSTTNERGSLIGSLKKEMSTHSLRKSVSIKTPSQIDSRNGDLTDDDQNGMTENFDQKRFSDSKFDAKGRNIKSPILDERKLKNDKNKRETLVIPPHYKMGVVPKYIKERKEEMASIIRQSEVIDINCPEGHISLPEQDRLKALEIAKKRFDSLICELNKMPMTSETLRIRNRKIEIEKELTKLEDSIRIFSRAKVYVKLSE